MPGDLLCMNGSDHLMPQPWLGRVVAEANDLQDDLHFEVTSLSQLPVEPGHGRPHDGARRAALGLPLQHADGRHLEPGRREAPGRPGRARARATRRAAVRALPAGRRVPDAPPRARLARDGAQLGPRLHLRLLGRRRRRRRPAPLRRGPDHRRRAWPTRAVKSFARSLAEPGPSVLNLSARARSGVVELIVPADGPAPDDVQVLSERSRAAGLDGARRRHRPHHAGHAAGPEDQRRRLDPRRQRSSRPTRGST